MDSGTIALIGIIVLFLLMFLKMPISFAMFIVGFLGIYFILPPNAAFNLLSSNIWTQFSSYSLSVIPFYVLMGEIVFRSELVKIFLKPLIDGLVIFAVECSLQQF